MSATPDAQQLEELVKRIEDYISQGNVSSTRPEEILAMINQAEAIFDEIIVGYINNPVKPSFTEAYIVSELQDRLRQAKDSVHTPPVTPEHPGDGTDAKVTLYTMTGCPWCRKTREYLAQKGISYIEHNIARDRAKADEMVEKSGQTGVPVIIIGDQIVIGFDQRRLDRLLS